ncbi:DUF2914 domain-containing protein [Corallococcus sp. H22C18031201]|nr:DUF2914 domain-containing protein [Corallococcus sp. H22C18031201]
MLNATPPKPGQTPQDETPEAPAPLGGAPTAESNTGHAPPSPGAAVDPDDLVATAKTPTLIDRVQAFRSRYEKEEMALFFFAGFLYDILTLSPIDDGFSLAQSFVYLCVLAGLLLLEQRFPEGTEPPKLLARVWRFREDGLHFFFGSLLSSFTLFLFKSTSGFTPFFFLLAMFGLLVANELPRFRQLGPVIRVVLFSLCVTLYFAYLVPVLLGRMGWWVFTLAVLLGCGSIYGLLRVIRRWRPDMRFLVRNVAVPGFGTQVALLGCYLLGLIPPVPLAVQYSGLYHEVKKVSPGVYQLSYEERPFWQFWHHGNQHFLARAGEQPQYFFRIFAPSNFAAYKVRVRWFFDHPDKGWTSLGSGWLASVKANGAEGGYRSMARPGAPLKPGNWRVVVETEDGHEINRLSFTVEADARTEPRVLAQEMSVLNRIEPMPLEAWQQAYPQAVKPAEAAPAPSGEAPVPQASETGP